MALLDWAADGKGFLIESFPGLLLFVDMDGRTDILWKSEAYPNDAPWGVPSPNGRHLAMLGWSVDNDIWMLENS